MLNPGIKKLLLIVGVASLFTPASSYAQNLFQPKFLKDNQGDTLPYRILFPEKIKNGKQYPLILFYHGSGERGNDNFSQLKWGVRHFATPKIRHKYPAFVVAPQCPRDSQWVDINYDNFPVTLPLQPSHYIALSIELIRFLEQKYPIDPNRIYVMGISSGAYAVWAAIERRPDLFAAAVPIAGGGDPTKANLLTHMSIWAFEGKRDHEVPRKFMDSMIDAIRKDGGRPRYTVYPKTGHTDTWIKAFNDRRLYRWLFRQHKKDKISKK